MEFDRTHGNEYHSSAIALNSGRHCLQYLILAKHIKKLYIPYHLCASVRGICEKTGCDYEYYNIDGHMLPIFEKTLKTGEYLYIVNYYGQIDNRQITEYKIKYGNIIIDNVQAFFQEPAKDADTIYSCRKFFGVPDGAYLYTDAKLDDKLEQDISYEEIGYILGRFERDASSFYGEYQKHERAFETKDLKGMSKLTHNLLRGIDYDFVKKSRSENFVLLHEKLANINKFELKTPEVAFMYPLFTENGSELKNRLIEKKIYVPTLWPDTFDVIEKGSVEWEFAENIVPLPIDQRYGINEMDYISRTVKEYIS